MAYTNISGKDGKVLMGATVIGNCKKIALSTKSNNPQFAHESSDGYKVSVAGVKSGSLSFDLVLDTQAAAYNLIDVGDAVTLKIYEDDTRFWSIPCRIDDIDENIDIDGGGEVTLGYKASTNGAWTKPT